MEREGWTCCFQWGLRPQHGRPLGAVSSQTLRPRPDRLPPVCDPNAARVKRVHISRREADLGPDHAGDAVTATESPCLIPRLVSSCGSVMALLPMSLPGRGGGEGGGCGACAGTDPERNELQAWSCKVRCPGRRLEGAACRKPSRIAPACARPLPQCHLCWHFWP